MIGQTFAQSFAIIISSRGIALMSATIIDVAQKAGVSTTTVSHVINQTRFVSEDLRKRVYSAMEELNYHPNSLARGLRRGETKTIGLIAPDNSNPFFAEILRLIEDIGFREGYSVILCNSDGDLAKEIAYTNVLFAKQVDGIIFIGTNNSAEHLLALVRQGIPIVVVDRDISIAETDTVLVDNFLGGYMAAQYLIGLGHRRIACITGPSELTPSADRVHGYRKAMEEAGIPCLAEYVIPGDFRFGGGEEGMARLLDLPVPPSAVFACNDIMALGAMKTLRKRNITPPQQLSIIGFDDIILASVIAPALTTIAQPLHEIANNSIHLLLSRIHQTDADHDAQRLVLPPRLLVRETCAPFIGE
jgi:LacI family transcriptional regulator